MKQTVKNPTKGQSLKKEKQSTNVFSQKELALKEGTTAKGLILKMQRDARKATNEAQKEAQRDAKDNERTLGYQYRRLQSYAEKFCTLLSDETGKKVTAENIRSLKFKDFCPYITEHETALFFGNWTFSRFLTVIKRYYRNETKNNLSASQIAEISTVTDEISESVESK